MAYQVIVDKVAVVKPDDTEDTIVHKGALLPDWVDTFTLFVLTSTGMVKFVEEPDPAVRPAAAGPAPVLLAEHPAPAGSVEDEAKSARRPSAAKS